LLLFLDGTIVVDKDKGVAELGILGAVGAGVAGTEIALRCMSNVGGVRHEMRYLGIVIWQRGLGGLFLETSEAFSRRWDMVL
jgi:hypothetical protein